MAKRRPTQRTTGSELPRGTLVSSRRVLLRHPVAADRAELLALRKDSWGFLGPWEPRHPVDPCGAEWFRGFLKGAHLESGERLLVCRRSDGAILGSFSLHMIARGPFQNAVLSYWVGERHAGQGYMSEGLALVKRRAFGTLRLHRLEANIQPDNAPSIALVRRAGFRLEGYSPRYIKIRGRWRDHERWALLADE